MVRSTVARSGMKRKRKKNTMAGRAYATPFIQRTPSLDQTITRSGKSVSQQNSGLKKFLVLLLELIKSPSLAHQASLLSLTSMNGRSVMRRLTSSSSYASLMPS